MTLAVVLAALMSLPNTGMSDAPGVSGALLRASNGDVRVLSLLMAIGYHESRYLDRIQAGQCRPPTRGYAGECDAFVHRGQVRFRARSWFQLHRSACASRAEWESTTGLAPENVDAAAMVAANRLRRGMRACRTTAGIVSYYAYGSCRPWPGASSRVALAARIESRLRAPPRS